MALPWTLTPRQAEVFRSPARYNVLVAGRRFGKTVLAVAWLLAEVVRRGPGSRAYFVAPYRVMAKAIAWEMLLKATRGLRTAKNESELTVTLRGGRQIALKGADDPETLEGVGLVAVVMDEFARMKLDAWQKSIRPALSDRGGRALFCGKPRGHNHLKDFFERGRDAAHPEWRSWLFTTLDGGFVPRDDVAEARAQLPAKVFRQEYEATWETAAGRVYEDFARRTHVVPHADLERRFRDPGAGRWRFRRAVLAIDWGYTDPGCALVVGQDALGDLYVVAEEYRTGVLVDASGWLGIFKRMADEHRCDLVVGDPSAPGHLAATRLHLRGAPVVREAQNDLREGIRRVQVALLPRAHHGRPGLVVSDRCAHLVREAEGYVFREHRGVATEEPVDADNHALDALRYAVMALTAGPGAAMSYT